MNGTARVAPTDRAAVGVLGISLSLVVHADVLKKMNSLQKALITASTSGETEIGLLREVMAFAASCLMNSTCTDEVKANEDNLACILFRRQAGS